MKAAYITKLWHLSVPFSFLDIFNVWKQHLNILLDSFSVASFGQY